MPVSFSSMPSVKALWHTLAVGMILEELLSCYFDSHLLKNR